jgi:hypothetical protein
MRVLSGEMMRDVVIIRDDVMDFASVFLWQTE